MKKKIISALLSVAMLCSTAVPMVTAQAAEKEQVQVQMIGYTVVGTREPDMKIYVNNKLVEFDQYPIIAEGNTLVPMRAIFEALNCEVTWDDTVKKAHFTSNGTEYVLSHRGTQIVIANTNIIAYNLDVSANLIDGRMFVPLRAVSEVIGCKVDWDESTKTVNITGNYTDTTPVTELTKTKIDRNWNNSYMRGLGGCTSEVTKNYIYEEGSNLVTITAEDTSLKVSYFDKVTLEKKSEQTVNYELSKFGGFFKGEKYNFCLFGQENPDLSPEQTVLRVVKYDKDFNRLGECNISDIFTYSPFLESGSAFAEKDGNLTVLTTRFRCPDENDEIHQSNFVVQIDEDSMQTTYVQGDTSGMAFIYHSMHQFINYSDKGDLVFTEVGDYNPRGIRVIKYPANQLNPMFNTSIVTVGGQAPDAEIRRFSNNFTGLILGGVVTLGDNTVVVYNDGEYSDEKHDRKAPNAESEFRNVKVAIVDNKGDFKTITVDRDLLKKGSRPYILKLTDDKFIVMWQELSTNASYVWYAVFNADGSRVTENTKTSKGTLSEDCYPILLDDNIVWFYEMSGEGKMLCELNVSEYLK